MSNTPDTLQLFIDSVNAIEDQEKKLNFIKIHRARITAVLLSEKRTTNYFLTQTWLTTSREILEILDLFNLENTNPNLLRTRVKRMKKRFKWLKKTWAKPRKWITPQKRSSGKMD